MTLRDSALGETTEVLLPLPRTRTERAGVRGHCLRAAQLEAWPLTLTLSPEYGGEGTRKNRA